MHAATFLGELHALDVGLVAYIGALVIGTGCALAWMFWLERYDWLAPARYKRCPKGGNDP